MYYQQLNYKCRDCGIRYSEEPKNGCNGSGCNCFEFILINEQGARLG
jgi:hypothetical protein